MVVFAQAREKAKASYEAQRRLYQAIDTESDYLSYLKKTFPPTWTTDARHIRLIAEHLDKVQSGEIDRLAIHMPPRHGKSETVTVRFPLYALEHDPTANVLVTGYNERFARKFGRKTRNLGQSRGLVSDDKSAQDEWATKQGGLYMARGVGSPPTGTGFKLIVIDDPIRRREDAESEVYREKVWDWYTDDLYTRLEPGGAIVLVMTLWHEDDIGARAIASEPGRWTILKLPAIAEEDDSLGRPKGEPLWPERYDAEAIERIRQVMLRNEGERSYEALYQQNPKAREGNLFKVDKIEFVTKVPGLLNKARGWDLAATENDGDWTAGVKIEGPCPKGLYYVTPKRFRHEPYQRNQEIKKTAREDGKDVFIVVPEDPGAGGKEAAQSLVKFLAGFPVRAKRVTGEKELRAEPFASQVNAGNVRVVHDGTPESIRIAKEYVEELRTFPEGKHDDQVDASSDAFNQVVKGPVKRTVQTYDY